LRAFTDERLSVEDYEEAARCHNTCRSAGLAGNAIDFLICASALRRDLSVFTTDRDFQNYARTLSITLHGRRRRTSELGI
ncbi:MAG: hypothetical protein HY678_04525, partial [Chloroflexi bacterium]|nr:hypothetical protein [Chloroflexota bacterium]